MSKLDDLIKNLCPDGVEFKKLGEVFNIRNGYTPSTKNLNFWEGGTISWFRMDDIRINGRILKDSLKKITPSGVKGKLFEKNSIILATTATIGEHALLLSESLANQQFTNFSIREEFKNKLLPKFIFYYFFVIDNWCKENIRVSSFPSVDMDKLKNFKIPVPPIEVQAEIVRILDKFADSKNELISLLQAELTARKKQYEYYRDLLLTFDGVEFKTLGEICESTQKISWAKSDKNYKYIDLSSVNLENKKIIETTIINKNNAPSRAQQILKSEDILFGTTRPTLKRFCIVPKDYDGQICSTGFCILRANKKFVLPLWIYFNISSTKFFNYVSKVQHGTSYPMISDSEIKDFEIPIPPIEEQERIVKILDRFDKLCNDISEGLPAEIAARQKQYEYYRDKLLTFKEII